MFDKDRACAEAWYENRIFDFNYSCKNTLQKMNKFLLIKRKRGGYEEEKKEKLKWNAAQQKKILDSVRGR